MGGLLFLGESEGVEFHLFDHGGEAVGACGREVLFESYLVDKGEVGVEDVLRCLAVEGADEERDDAFGDDGVAVGLEPEFAVVVLTAEPNAALAAFDEVVVGFVGGVDGGAFLAEIDDVGVFVEPFVEGGEFVDDGLFYFLNCHG